MAQPTHTVCLTFDFDGMSSWIGSWQSNNPSMISRGEFAITGLDRILALLAKHDLRATFFVPGHTAWAWPDRDQEVEVMERGFEALDWAIGQRPVGYRSAAWDFSPNTIEVLLDYGFLY